MSLKFEVGKYYRDRAGRKHRVLATDLYLGNGESIVTVERQDGVDFIHFLDSDGSYSLEDNPIELVAEWQEPVTVERYALVAVRDVGQGLGYNRGEVWSSFSSVSEAGRKRMFMDNPEDWAIIKLTGTLDPNKPEDGE